MDIKRATELKNTPANAWDKVREIIKNRLNLTGAEYKMLIQIEIVEYDQKNLYIAIPFVGMELKSFLCRYADVFEEERKYNGGN